MFSNFSIGHAKLFLPSLEFGSIDGEEILLFRLIRMVVPPFLANRSDEGGRRA